MHKKLAMEKYINTSILCINKHIHNTFDIHSWDLIAWFHCSPMSSSKQNNPLIELFVPALFHRGWKKKTFLVNPCSASISLVSEIKIKPVNTPYFLDKYHVFQNLTHDEKLILHLLLNVKAVILISMNNVFELWSHHRACLQIVTSFAIFFFLLHRDH